MESEVSLVTYHIHEANLIHSRKSEKDRKLEKNRKNRHRMFLLPVTRMFCTRGMFCESKLRMSRLSGRNVVCVKNVLTVIALNVLSKKNIASVIERTFFAAGTFRLLFH